MQRRRHIIGFSRIALGAVLFTVLTAALPAAPSDQIHIASGVVEGTTGTKGVRAYLGIPYAATRNAATRNAATRNAATRNAATRNAATRNAATRNAATRNAATRNAATRNAAKR